MKTLNEEIMTLETFRQEHSNDVIRIMSPGGYVIITPDISLEQLYAHPGERGLEIPIAWEELKDQIVHSSTYDQTDKCWDLLTVTKYEFERSKNRIIEDEKNSHEISM